MRGDAQLEERVRDQLDRWATRAFPDDGEAIEPPAPRSSPVVAGRPRRTPRVLVAAVVVGVLVVAIGAVVVRESEPTDRPADGPQSAVVRVEWRFRAFVVDGERWSVPASVDARIRFDGKGHFSGTACNNFFGDAEISPDRVKFGREMGWTAMACTDIRSRIEDAVSELVYSKVTWSRDGDTLRLEGGGIEAELTRLPDAFPTPDLVVLARSPEGEEAQWHFGYRPNDPSMLRWEGRDEPGSPFGSVEVRAMPNLSWGSAVAAGTAPFIFGYLPGTSVTAKYVVVGEPPVVVKLYPLPGGSRAFGQTVTEQGGRVVAYDREGNEIAGTRSLPRVDGLD